MDSTQVSAYVLAFALLVGAATLGAFAGKYLVQMLKEVL